MSTIDTSHVNSEKKIIIASNQDGLQRKLLDLDQTRKTLANFKTWEEQEFDTKLKRNDMKRGEIVFLAQRFEQYFRESGFELFISEISTYIDSIFQFSGLSTYSSLIRECLPDKYKNQSKQNYKNISSRIVKSTLEKSLTEIEKAEITLVDSDYIKELYERCMDVSDIFKNEMKARGMSLLDIGEEKNSNWDTDLKKSEKSKFKKAEVGKPISTVEELIDKFGEPYERAYNRLVKAQDHFIRIATMMKEKYTKEFPPLSVKTCNDFAEGTEMFNELLIPLVDNKHRRDHYQLWKIACQKKVTTSVKASKVSRIPAANHVDPKTGLPVLRGLTKEQIDSMWVQEINFFIKLVNEMFGYLVKWSAGNEEHRVRCLDDRAIDLGPNLTHKA